MNRIITDAEAVLVKASVVLFVPEKLSVCSAEKSIAIYNKIWYNPI